MALANHEWRCRKTGSAGCYFTAGGYSSLADGDWEEKCGPRPANLHCGTSGLANVYGGVGKTSFDTRPQVSVKSNQSARVVGIPTMTGRTVFADTPRTAALSRGFRNFNAAITASIFPTEIQDDRPVEPVEVVVEEKAFGFTDLFITIGLAAAGWYLAPKIKDGKYSRILGAGAGLAAGITIYKAR